MKQAELNSITAYKDGTKLFSWRCICGKKFLTPYGFDYICSCGEKHIDLRYI